MFLGDIDSDPAPRSTRCATTSSCSARANIRRRAFLQDADDDLIPPDSGDFAADLRDWLRRLAGFLGESDSGAVFRALLAQAQHDPAFAGEFRSCCLGPQRRRDRALLERAVTAGRLPAGLDLETETDQLVGPLYYRALVSAGPVGEEFTDALADAFLLRRGGPASAR
ncbi:TetR-like C-terminal domain-containing protein [Streptomyces sp. NPDC002677]|uniref:TetR-like C-terminal domain-containing protein n=1 Tax=Streptomyces sp. NPDC002677 TaxID=3154774 RepID=UPI003331C80B